MKNGAMNREHRAAQIPDTRLPDILSFYRYLDEIWTLPVLKRQVILNFLTLEEGTDRLFRNVNKELPLYAA